MKKRYMAPKTTAANLMSQVILAGSITKPVDDNPAGEDDFDANRNGSFWDDED